MKDLSQGNYEVTVDVGQSFATRRDATVKSLLSMLALIPPGTPKHDLVSSMILDNMDGEETKCVQLISRYGIYCNYFLKAVLPDEKELYTEILQQNGVMR